MDALNLSDLGLESSKNNTEVPVIENVADYTRELEKLLEKSTRSRKQFSIIDLYDFDDNNTPISKSRSRYDMVMEDFNDFHHTATGMRDSGEYSPTLMKQQRESSRLSVPTAHRTWKSHTIKVGKNQSKFSATNTIGRQRPILKTKSDYNNETQELTNILRTGNMVSFDEWLQNNRKWYTKSAGKIEKIKFLDEIAAKVISIPTIDKKSERIAKKVYEEVDRRKKMLLHSKYDEKPLSPSKANNNNKNDTTIVGDDDLRVRYIDRVKGGDKGGESSPTRSPDKIKVVSVSEQSSVEPQTIFERLHLNTSYGTQKIYTSKLEKRPTEEIYATQEPEFRICKGSQKLLEKKSQYFRDSGIFQFPEKALEKVERRKSEKSFLIRNKYARLSQDGFHKMRKESTFDFSDPSCRQGFEGSHGAGRGTIFAKSSGPDGNMMSESELKTSTTTPKKSIKVVPYQPTLVSSQEIRKHVEDTRGTFEDSILKRTEDHIVKQKLGREREKTRKFDPGPGSYSTNYVDVNKVLSHTPIRCRSAPRGGIPNRALSTSTVRDGTTDLSYMPVGSRGEIQYAGVSLRSVSPGRRGFSFSKTTRGLA